MAPLACLHVLICQSLVALRTLHSLLCQGLLAQPYLLKHPTQGLGLRADALATNAVQRTRACSNRAAEWQQYVWQQYVIDIATCLQWCWIDGVGW